jgi:hypothetical protein
MGLTELGVDKQYLFDNREQCIVFRVVAKIRHIKDPQTN